MAARLNARVATEVRAELARQRVSANDFARRVGWTQPYIQRRIVGAVPMSLDDLETICRELGVKVVVLIQAADRSATERAAS